MSTTVATTIEAVIGLEVHAELLTRSKMFCACPANYLVGEPNSHTCPVCLGLPGSLPVINGRAVEMTITTALALSCEIPEFSKFDRKNYFYPDLPKGYQISQYDLPLSRHGHLDVHIEGESRRIGVTRVHLEEDTGKLLHTGSIHTSTASLVDLNRAGVPLLEIVSEPDLRNAGEAREYMQRLRQLLVWIGVSDGRMEEGSLRCDANVSVRPAGSSELGVKVEVKNMNSFRAVHLALEHEIERQRAALASGAAIVQETRGWNESEGVTVAQRSKEYAHDYRYFPEPDLPPLHISRETVESRRAGLPELPAARADRIMREHGLAQNIADLLTATRELADYFEDVVRAGAPAGEAANWMLGEVSRVLNETNGQLPGLSVRPRALAALIARKQDGTMSNNQAKELFLALARTLQHAASITQIGPRPGVRPQVITPPKWVLREDRIFDSAEAIEHEIEAAGMRQVSDAAQLEAWARQAIQNQPQAATDFRAGNERASGRLVGEVMKLSQGQASGPAVMEILRKLLT
jgi:aspartyl-tRNA(Asn)/glutamyl-tRNA(Gln) amidotransferase subunit B